MKNNPRLWAKPLLILHLFVMCVWLYFLGILHGGEGELYEWMMHVLFLSLIGIQFTWGFTVGLIVGPKRQNRNRLWWSLLTISIPASVFGWFLHVIVFSWGILVAALYLAAFVFMLACETYGGVMLGAQIHAQVTE